ncbi:vomeronasal type-1 receptor 46-like [Fukomys damarensis]|uniref:vomeronasal type-1 receptor 46-like n=1 Tax=Fukomys damarensis TaxID=885580 RepID=UPI001455B2AD|nr:vomeronasal type-1 receptor 46-like [Fukomys damarensis]
MHRRQGCMTACGTVPAQLRNRASSQSAPPRGQASWPPLCPLLWPCNLGLRASSRHYDLVQRSLILFLVGIFLALVLKLLQIQRNVMLAEVMVTILSVAWHRHKQCLKPHLLFLTIDRGSTWPYPGFTGTEPDNGDTRWKIRGFPAFHSEVVKDKGETAEGSRVQGGRECSSYENEFMLVCERCTALSCEVICTTQAPTDEALGLLVLPCHYLSTIQRKENLSCKQSEAGTLGRDNSPEVVAAVDCPSQHSEQDDLNFIRKIVFISFTGTGIAGNLFLFVKHVYTAGLKTGKKPTDFIVIQLAFANVITLWISGISHIRSPFNFHYFLGNVSCKIVIFLGRVARGLSLCTTCFLSIVQAITISPRNTPCPLKPQKKCQVLSCLLLLWILNFLISSNLLHYIRAVNTTAIRMHIGCCYMMSSRQIIRWIFLSLMTLRDIIFQSLMGWSSGYMALHLYNHHKRVLYLHSSRLANNSSPEIRATLSVLILMVCFLFFYWADFILSFYRGSTMTLDFTMLNIKIFLDLGYVVLSPFVLISRDVHMVKCWHRQRI